MKIESDLWLQESEGFKFFYLAENNPFYTMVCKWQRCNCGHEISVVDNDNCASCFGKYSRDGNEEWIQCPASGQKSFNEQCFYN